MWSNGVVADDNPDDASPWMRDDWVPDSTEPDTAVFATGRRPPAGPSAPSWSGGADEPPPEDFDDPGADVGAPRSNVGRKVIAGGVVIALLVGSAGALLRDDGESETDPDPTSPAVEIDDTVPVTTTLDTIPPTSVRTLDALVTPEPGRTPNCAGAGADRRR